MQRGILSESLFFRTKILRSLGEKYVINDQRFSIKKHLGVKYLCQAFSQSRQTHTKTFNTRFVVGRQLKYIIHVLMSSNNQVQFFFCFASIVHLVEKTMLFFSQKFQFILLQIWGNGSRLVYIIQNIQYLLSGAFNALNMHS